MLAKANMDWLLFKKELEVPHRGGHNLKYRHTKFHQSGIVYIPHIIKCIIDSCFCEQMNILSLRAR